MLCSEPGQNSKPCMKPGQMMLFVKSPRQPRRNTEILALGPEHTFGYLADQPPVSGASAMH